MFSLQQRLATVVVTHVGPEDDSVFSGGGKCLEAVHRNDVSGPSVLCCSSQRSGDCCDLISQKGLYFSAGGVMK